MNAKQLREAALSLSPEDRAGLAQDLLRSLDGPADANVQDSWLAELEKRAGELADGSVTPVDWSEARERIARRLRERSQ